jgi:hypothetical protein
MSKLTRRELIKATGAIGATILPSALATDTASAQPHDHASPVPSSPPAAAVAPPTPKTAYLFFNSEEEAFIEAAVARLIPKDDQWAGAIVAQALDPPEHSYRRGGRRISAGNRLGRRQRERWIRSVAPVPHYNILRDAAAFLGAVAFQDRRTPAPASRCFRSPWERLKHRGRSFSTP